MNCLISFHVEEERDTFFCVIRTAGLGSKGGSNGRLDCYLIPGKTMQHFKSFDSGLDIWFPRQSELTFHCWSVHVEVKCQGTGMWHY